jgi:hypothetical protein
MSPPLQWRFVTGSSGQQAAMATPPFPIGITNALFWGCWDRVGGYPSICHQYAGTIMAPYARAEEKGNSTFRK